MSPAIGEKRARVRPDACFRRPVYRSEACFARPDPAKAPGLAQLGCRPDPSIGTEFATRPRLCLFASAT
jgi:hypothetical protein